MDSQDLRNLSEAYNNVYEQQIGVPLKDSSDRAAKEQLKRMIPKGEKIYTPKSSLQNAAYEPEGEFVEEDIRNRDVSARGGFDPRFDRRPKPTTGTTPRPSTPTTTTAPKPTGPVAQAPKPSGGGVLGQLDSLARKTAGEIGGRIGEREGRRRTGNLPVLGDIGGALGRRQGTQQGQQTYDRLKNTATQALGGLLKQDYDYDIDERYVPWDFGPKDKAKAKFDKLAQRKAQEKSSGVQGGRGTATRANRIAAVARDMRTTLDKDSAATGTDPRRQGLQPSTARHTAAAQRGAGGGSTARKSYNVKPLRNRGGSSSLGGVGTASGTGRYTPGGGGRFGLAGTGLADSYVPDTFDIILEYLVAEGYADTNDNALVIMANMSEEWKYNIINR